MNASEVDRSGDTPADKPHKTPPARMSGYSIVAEPRTEPDLHKLAQLFIGMAFARADAEREARRNSGTDREQAPQAAHWAGRTPRSGRSEAVGGC